MNCQIFVPKGVPACLVLPLIITLNILFIRVDSTSELGHRSPSPVVVFPHKSYFCVTVATVAKIKLRTIPFFSSDDFLGRIGKRLPGLRPIKSVLSKIKTRLCNAKTQGQNRGIYKLHNDYFVS